MKRTPITRKTPVRKANPKRKAKEFARTYGSGDRVEFVKALPCSVLGCNHRPSENAHVGLEAGMGRKADADTIIPLCHDHHDEYHTVGRDSFAHLYKMDYAYHARLTELAWSMIDPEAR